MILTIALLVLAGLLLWWAYSITLPEEECQAELDAYVAEKLRREQEP